MSERTTRTERTRGALLAAGRRLFGEKPIDAVSIDDIVQAANVAKGSFYNHFADRDALAQAISAEIRASIEGAIGLANAKVDDPARRVARAVCIYLRFALEDAERAGFIVRVHSGHTALATPLNQGLFDDIAKGLGEGRFAVATVETGALYILGVTQIALVRLVHEPGQALAVSLGQQMCALLLRGLGVPAAEADLIAAQASEDIIRAGAFMKALKPPPGERH
jgi:AcrR family transcriptional regulator